MEDDKYYIRDTNRRQNRVLNSLETSQLTEGDAMLFD